MVATTTCIAHIWVTTLPKGFSFSPILLQLQPVIALLLKYSKPERKLVKHFLLKVEHWQTWVRVRQIWFKIWETYIQLHWCGTFNTFVERCVWWSYYGHYSCRLQSCFLSSEDLCWASQFQIQRDGTNLSLSVCSVLSFLDCLILSDCLNFHLHWIEGLSIFYS